MISVNNVSLQFGPRKLFSEVNIVFSPGNCYGLIGANGSGKSTFLKILSGEVDSTAGEVVIASGKRVSTLRQDQFAFDEYTALTTVIMGHKKLYEIMQAKDAIYSKTPLPTPMECAPVSLRKSSPNSRDGTPNPTRPSS